MNEGKTVIYLDSVSLTYLGAGGTVIIDELGIVIKPGGGLQKIQNRIKTKTDSGVYRQRLIGDGEVTGQ